MVFCTKQKYEKRNGLKILKKIVKSLTSLHFRKPLLFRTLKTAINLKSFKNKLKKLYALLLRK